MESIKVSYSKDCLQIATCSFWWHRIGSQYLFILIPVIAFLIYRIQIGDISWLVWIVGLGAAYYSVQGLVLFILYLTTQLRWFRSLNEPETELEVKEEYLRIKSDADESEIEWNSIYDIRFNDKFWILILAPYMLNYVVLPVDNLSQNAKSLIISKIDSVLFRTGQVWKIRVRLLFSYLALFSLIGHLAFKPLFDEYVLFSYAMAGIFAAIALTLFYSVRCPNCGNKWDSKEAKENSKGRWPHWLFALQKCPFCGKTGDDLDDVKHAEST